MSQLAAIALGAKPAYRSMVPTCRKPQRMEHRKRKAVTHEAQLELSASRLQ